MSIDPSAPLVRAMVFALPTDRAGTWHGGSPVRSHLFNALSAFLPGGEAMFVRAVRAAVESKTGHEFQHVDRFARQEAAHQKHHEAYNACIGASYPDFTRFVRYLSLGFKGLSAVTSRRSRLAFTVALEHVTAVFARFVLSSRSALAEAECEFAALWAWHSLEELEHKSVAFDVYRAANLGRIRRCLAMAVITLPFLCEYLILFGLLLRQDKVLLKRDTWREVGRLLGSPEAGEAWRAYLAFYAGTFDPADADDTRLVGTWREHPTIVSRLERPPR